VGGGWGQELVAHESHCFAVGDLASRRAVLAEPASIGLHAALRWERAGDRVVVIGPGTIGLLVTAALRMLHPDLDILRVSPGEFGSQKALAAGADRILPAGSAAVQSLADTDGGRVLRPRMTRTPILEQGVDAVFDCVGHSDTIDLGLHLLRPRGTLVLVGAAGSQDADWSLVWHRELSIQGAAFYAPEPQLDGRTTMAQVAEWLADPGYRVDGLVTHTYDLSDWTSALNTADRGPGADAVKVTLRPNPDLPLVGEPG
jgi:threonine dehydrogenase-like Zn-dependent dehydrogenase